MSREQSQNHKSENCFGPVTCPSCRAGMGPLLITRMGDEMYEEANGEGNIKVGVLKGEKVSFLCVCLYVCVSERERDNGMGREINEMGKGDKKRTMGYVGTRKTLQKATSHGEK